MLPFRMQSVLMSAMRGYDPARKDDPSKFVQRALRGLVFNNADPTNTFIVGDGTVDLETASKFLWDIDAYSMHYVMHTAHAAEIVGYKHPDDRIRSWWLDFYKKICKGFHLNFETEAQLDIRLGFTPAELEMLPSGWLKPKLKPDVELELHEKPEEKLEEKKPVAPASIGKAPGTTSFSVQVEPSKRQKVEPPKRQSQEAAKWDAGTGTSHGGRDRSYSGSS